MSADAFVDCAERGDLEGVRQHLYEGVDINHITKRGSTALMCAAANGHDDIVIFLIYQGADRAITNEKGRTALDYAIKARKYDTARLFPEYVAIEVLNSGRASLHRLMRGMGEGQCKVK